MTASKTPRARAGRGTLHIVAGFLVASAVLRVAVTATEVEAEVAAEIVEPATPDAAPSNNTSEVLAALKAREDRLIARETQVANRLQALRVAETEITEKLVALTTAEEKLSATMALAESAADSDLNKLALVYQNMKPKDAAALFATMAPGFAAGFLGLMPPEAAASIMTELEPDTAYSISVMLAGRNAGVPRQ